MKIIIIPLECRTSGLKIIKKGKHVLYTIISRNVGAINSPDFHYNYTAVCVAANQRVVSIRYCSRAR